MDFSCAYVGMIGGITFELSAGGVPDGPGACDAWAKKVAGAVEKMSVKNIGDK